MSFLVNNALRLHAKFLGVLVLFYTTSGAFAASPATLQFAEVMNAPDVTTTHVKLSVRTCFVSCIADQGQVLNVTKHLIKGDHAFSTFELSRLDSGVRFP